MNVKHVSISDIKITSRIRKEHGDLNELAESMNEGLLQPIGITPEKELVFGERRLLAARDILGWKKIPARIVDVASVLHGQFAENLMRKRYTVSERVAIVEAMRSFKHGGDRRSKQARICDDETVTVDQAAKLAGLGGKDGYARARTIIEKGVPELVQALEQGKFSLSKAAEIAKLPEEDQRESARRGRRVFWRDPDDFYLTPPEVTRALLKVEKFDGKIWEPACGNGAMSSVLQEAGYDVVSSDLKDRGYGDVENFLTSNRVSENIVTNPPFDHDEDFVRRALRNTERKVAMLLPLTFLEGTKRAEWLVRSPLKKVHIFSNRINCSRNGEKEFKNGRFVFAWFIWEHGYRGSPQIDWISTNGIDTSPGRGKEHPLEKAKLLPINEARPIHVNSVTEGDCRELISQLPDGKIDLCLCSPPYGNQRKGMYPGIPDDKFPSFMVHWMDNLRSKLNDRGSVMIVIRPDLKRGVIKDYVLRTRLALRESGWNECEELIWFKPDGGGCQGSMKRPRRAYEHILWFSKSHDPFSDPKTCGGWSGDLSCRGSTRFGVGDDLPIHSISEARKGSGATRGSDVLVVPIGKMEKGIMHPAMFPVELAEQLIRTFCPPGGTVLDPFAGSGSTLVAAKKLGCNYYAFDVMPEFCKIARKRLAATINDRKVSDAG